MKKGLSLTELASKIEANRELKQDYIVPAEKLEMRVAQADQLVDNEVVNELQLNLREQNIDPLAIRDTAHCQIADKLNIPQKYYRKMQAEQPDLLCDNVNTWLEASDKKQMVRTIDDEARAFLSNRYQRIENEEIAEVALPILAELPDVQFVSTEVTDRRMYIQAVVPSIQADVGDPKIGDTMQAGVIVSNSEIGWGSVSVVAMAWRLWCLNGCTLGDPYRKFHVGRQIEDNAELWSQETVQADDKAVLLKVKDMIRAAVDAHKFRARVEEMTGLTEIRVEGDPARAVEVLAKKVGVTKDEQGGILRSLIEGGDLSAWGLLNSVTHQAHDAVTYDRAVEFETAGGRLLEMKKSEWTEILTAA